MIPEENRYCVYFHYKKTNNSLFYVGIGSKKRAASAFGRNKLWGKISAKHGFYFKIIEDKISWERACELEKRFISMYGRIDKKSGCLANLTDGGDGSVGVISSAKHIERARKRFIEDNPMKNIECREKVALCMRARVVSDITRKKFSDRMKGKKPPFLLTGKTYWKSGSENKASRKVICLATNIIYDTVSDAANSVGLKRTTLIAMMSGQNKNKTTLQYA